ncbi:MAG: 6,7-dimethyl-8-ribityllumazine synthase [Gaiellaceae bacterium]
MSSRDIDSTSENVLHDWARDAEHDGEQDAEHDDVPVVPEPEVEIDAAEPVVRDEGGAGLAWGAASAPAEHEETVAATTAETEPEEALEQAEVDEDVSELEEGEIDETPMQVELSHEHAAGDLHIPDGYAVLEGVAEGGRRAVGIVVSRFNGSVTSQLLDRALAELATAGVRQETITIMVVPGAFELPLAATALAKTRRFACIVALGCVIRGDTPHFDYVSSEAASGLQLAALETGVPVSFGLLTLDRVEQAEARIGKGAEAVRSALEMADLFAHLRAAASR